MKVVGGYITPSHDAASQRKLGRESCSGIHRVKMCQILTKESNWIMVKFSVHSSSRKVDPWQAVQEKNPGAAQTIRRLEHLMDEYYSPHPVEVSSSS